MKYGMFTRLTPYVVLTIGLCACAGLLLHHLDHPCIAKWDEIVHLVVVHNLYTDCCDPKLHTIDLGTDASDWTNNYIWLHKPLLPFYLRAALYHLLGESLFAFRLPSVLFALLTAIGLFVIAKRFSHAWIATAVALLFASNPFIFDLAQGWRFSDLTDVLNAFLLTIALGITLFTAASPGKQFGTFYFLSSITAGLVLALAYLCKDGLVFLPFTVFAIALVWQCRWRGLGYVLMAALCFGALVFPEYFYFSHRFPREFRYEQYQQISHLFTNVQGWGLPWHYYLTVYWWALLGRPLGSMGFLAMIAIVSPELRSRRNLLLTLWILIYLVPLSFAVSKIANFLVPVLPAVLLLVGFACNDIVRSKQWNPSARRVLAAMAAVICLAIIARASRRNWDASNIGPKNCRDQMALKAAAEGIKGQIPRDAVVVVDDSDLANAHLFFQYWSGVNSLPAESSFVESMPSRTHPLYKLSVGSAKDIVVKATGYQDWQRELTISGGTVNLNAKLLAASSAALAESPASKTGQASSSIHDCDRRCRNTDIPHGRDNGQLRLDRDDDKRRRESRCGSH